MDETKNKTNIIIAVILGVLVVIAAFQMFQIFGIKNNIASGAAVKSGAAVAPTASGGGVPSNIQNLPSMVGGC